MKSVISNIKLSVIGISENRIKKTTRLQDWVCSNRVRNRWVFIQVNYKINSDLEIYRSKALESIFIEIIYKWKEKNIVGCIYKYPRMWTEELNNQYMSHILEKISFEKSIYWGILISIFWIMELTDLQFCSLYHSPKSYYT